VFINAEDFFEVFTQIRDVFITGRKGSGKTLLAFAMAGYALDNHFVKGVFANIPHRYPVAPTVQDAFVIVDESWQFIDNRFSKSTFSFMGAWSRKTSSLWAFPSVYGVDLRVRNLQVERIADIRLFPVRVWLYRWQNVWGDKGHFFLVRPEAYYGLYDTKAIPVDDGGAVDSLLSLVPEGLQLVQRIGGSRSRRDGEFASAVATLNDFRSLESRVTELERVVEQIRQFQLGPERFS
jgi:hypothetical protein